MPLTSHDWPPDRLGFFLARHSRLWVVPSALALCGLVALLDYGPGRQLSCLLFYLAPVALAAWWGGFPAGVLLGLVAAVLRHLARAAHGAPEPAAVWLCDGAIHFSAFTLSSSLVARLRLALVRERALARTDPLTGAANGRTFYERAEVELARTLRTNLPLTLAYLDVDNFKAVNDRLGHPAGDELLREVAEVIREQTRADDLVARLGGDEFGLLLPGADAAGGSAALARLRDTLRQRVAARGWPVTFSIGAATFLSPCRDVDALVRHVDQLMYRVKRGGKDCLLHETVSGPGAVSGPDRRASVRLLSGCEAWVRAGGAPRNREWLGVIHDISRGGVGLKLPCCLPARTLVTIEPLPGSPARTLLARVVHTSAHGRVWLHGCDLAHHLSDEELREWLPPGQAVPCDDESAGLARQP